MSDVGKTFFIIRLNTGTDVRITPRVGLWWSVERTIGKARTWINPHGQRFHTILEAAQEIKLRFGNRLAKGESTRLTEFIAKEQGRVADSWRGVR